MVEKEYTKTRELKVEEVGDLITPFRDLRAWEMPVNTHFIATPLQTTERTIKKDGEEATIYGLDVSYTAKGIESEVFNVNMSKNCQDKLIKNYSDKIGAENARCFVKYSKFPITDDSGKVVQAKANSVICFIQKEGQRGKFEGFVSTKNKLVKDDPFAKEEPKEEVVVSEETVSDLPELNEEEATFMKFYFEKKDSITDEQFKDAALKFASPERYAVMLQHKNK